MNNLKTNHAAVWVSVVLITGLGFLWYDTLFGEKWMSLVGLDLATVEANPPGAGVWATNIVGTVVPMYMLSWLFIKLNVDTAFKGAKMGLMISFSFVFLSKMTSDMFAQNPYELSWIEGGFDVVALMIGGIILGAWTKKKA